MCTAIDPLSLALLSPDQEHMSVTPNDAPVCVTCWGHRRRASPAWTLDPLSSVQAAPPYWAALVLLPNEIVREGGLIDRSA